MRVVSQKAAERAPTEHRIVTGLGYVRVGKLPLPRAKSLAEPVRPPQEDAEEGSLHVLASSNGPEVTLAWKSNSWAHPTDPAAGNRMAWSPEHLGSSGWRYLRKA